MDAVSDLSLDSTGRVPGPLMGVGRTAEVFAWGEGQVLKLYRSGIPQQWVAQEARVGQIVFDAGLAAPAVDGVIELDGRLGIVCERLDGPSLLDLIPNRPGDIPALGRQFAEVHAQMHGCLRSELPSQRASLAGAIQYARQLPARLRQAVLNRLDRLPDGQAVCHGDYHPGNLVVTHRGLVVIDWMTACHGSPVGDVAATTLLFRIARVPEYYSSGTRQAVDQARRSFYEAYLSEYLSRHPFPEEEIEAWIPVLAAARLSQGIVEEEQELLRLAEAA